MLNPELCYKYDLRVVNNVNSLFHFTVIYILLHEIGHAYHGHFPPSRSNEIEADTFAANAMNNIKLSSSDPKIVLLLYPTSSPTAYPLLARGPATI